MTNQTSYVLHSGFSISGCRWVLGLGQGLGFLNSNFRIPDSGQRGSAAALVLLLSRPYARFAGAHGHEIGSDMLDQRPRQHHPAHTVSKLWTTPGRPTDPSGHRCRLLRTNKAPARLEPEPIKGLRLRVWR